MEGDNNYEVELTAGGRTVKTTSEGLSKASKAENAPIKPRVVEITIDYVSGISLTTKRDPKIGLIGTLKADFLVKPADIARILNLQTQGIPVSLTLKSLQGALDLRLRSVDSESGEIMQAVLDQVESQKQP